MMYSNMFIRPINWMHDEQGTYSYNILGALECTLINLYICDKINEAWDIDEMERYGFRFGTFIEREL